ncbi:hypothetical protein [Bdellovibrio sp. HCB337]|uniref:hypothetical protein n=1 Tax=Bdellovibrio sp. HCB337 TaxID=3394358 RepID=UPI0039A761B1
MNALLNNITFFSLTFFAMSAHAQQSSMELTCRAKAKEIAAQTYSYCVTDARNTQIDQIRKDYQKQLTELKAKYDLELKKIGGKGLTGSATPATKPSSKPAASASTGSTPKATKGIAKTLPTRKEVKNPAPAIQEVQEDKAVVVPDSTTPGVESEPSQNDANSDLKIELVPAPASSDVSSATSGDQVY